MKNKIRKNKKGIFDAVLIIVLIFCTALVIFFSVFLANKLQEELSPQFNNKSSEAFNQTVNQAVNWSDWLVLVMVFLGFLGIIITSFLFYSHPAFMVLWIFLAIGLLVLSVILANIYDEITTSSELIENNAYFSKTNYIFSHFPLFTLVIIGISIIIIYIKSQTRPF